jgi:hypothetical protein
MNVVVSINGGLPRSVQWQGETVRTAQRPLRRLRRRFHDDIHGKRRQGRCRDDGVESVLELARDLGLAAASFWLFQRVVAAPDQSPGASRPSPPSRRRERSEISRHRCALGWQAATNSTTEVSS